MKRFFKLFIITFIFMLFLLFLLCVLIKYDIKNHFEEERVNGHKPNSNFRFGYREKVEYYGLNFEEHKITTDDGYILTCWRLFKTDKKFSFSKKRAVLINHGLLDSAYTFLAFDDNKSLPLILAERGFDVWLTNNRGTIFSYEHIDKNRDSFSINSDYWDFTFHEMAQYDIVSNINYIKNITVNEKVSYLCHSQGCFQFLIGYILNHKFFDDSVDKFGTMGAVLKISEINKIFPKIIKYVDLFGWFEYFGIKNIMSFHEENTKYFGYLCNRFLFICKYVISGIIENDPTNKIDYGLIQNFYYYAPGGTSAKNLKHWLQVIEAPELRYFDYGNMKNMEKYNSTEPPKYNVDELKKMKLDIFITLSTGDPYCLPTDYEEIFNYISSARVIKKHVDAYNHLDYLWSPSASVEIYEDMYKFLVDSI